MKEYDDEILNYIKSGKDDWQLYFGLKTYNKQQLLDAFGVDTELTEMLRRVWKTRKSRGEV